MLHRSVILGVIDYGLGLTTLSQHNVLKMDRVQNEATRVFLGTTEDTRVEIMDYALDLPPLATGLKLEQVKAYLSWMQNLKHPLLYAVKHEYRSARARGKSWMWQAKQPLL